MLTYKEILELIDKVAASGISSVEIERAGVRVRIEGRRVEPALTRATGLESSFVPGPMLDSAPETSPVQLPAEEEAGVDSSTHMITSPIVGTFYRAANPESDPFVSVGERIEKGSVLCIVEAMKLMNEIESDVEGAIVKIYPQNGQPVEYGERLFAVRL